jgi:hypothetical protein
MNQEDWTTRKWRPMMAWMYMIICILDFALFPILWSILQAYYDGQVVNQWDPLTLKGAGLFHMAMGAVLGVAAWSRGQEKMAGVTNIQPTVTPPTSTRPTPAINNNLVQSDPEFRNTRND